MKNQNPFIEYTKWLFKWAAIILGCIALLVVVLALYFHIHDWWNRDRHIDNIRAVVKAGESVKQCSKDFPVFVGFLNESPKTISYIEIKVEARLPDHSTNLLGWDAEAKYDRIVVPKEGYGQCWNFPLAKPDSSIDLSKLNYTGKIESYSVRFQD